MTTEFQSLLGEEVANLYPLHGSLGGAVYSTVHGQESQPAAIKLIPFEGGDWEPQLNTWRETARLSHPGLVRILDSGHCEIHGAPFLYVVMERADGSLAEVLAERPLTAVEAEEMLTCTAAALRYLHENGFVHGRIKPANIMAVGDEIKLATDSVVRGNDTGEDVRMLESLATASRPHQPSPAAAPAQKAAAQRNRWPLYAIVAAVIAITTIVLLLRSGSVPSTANVAPIAAVPQESAPTTEVEIREIPSRAEQSGSWYVVAATYTRKADAEKRAQSITKKWPRFKPEVYSPPDAGYYLVLLGADLSQKAAAGVKQRAIAAGMPRDTYIKRLSR